MQSLVTPSVSRPAPLVGLLYIGLAWLYVGAVVLQLFAIGMVFLAGQGEWLAYHRTIGHSMGVLALALPLVAWIARLPRRILLAALGLLLLYTLQFVLLRLPGGSLLRALHAVNALAIFWLASASVSWAQQALSRNPSLYSIESK